MTTAKSYTVGTLVVDLSDAHSEQLIWRGTASGTLFGRPEKNAEKINKATARMFKQISAPMKVASSAAEH